MTVTDPSVSSLAALVLAAGKGTRMKSRLPKVLHRLAGVPLLGHVLSACEALGVSRTLVVVGHGADEVKAFLPADVEAILQAEQRGTAHAVMQAIPALDGFEGDLLILSGDVPLLSAETLQALLSRHRGAGAALSVLGFQPEDPARYGRLVRDQQGRLARIVEYADASEAERAIREVNAGVYVARWSALREALGHLDADNAQGEYYLPDAIAWLVGRGDGVEVVLTLDPIEVAGVNSRVELSELELAYRKRVVRRWLEAGVTFEDPATTVIGPEVEIGPDTVLEMGARLLGRTRIGEGCVVGAHSELVDTVLGDHVTIRQSVLHQVTVEAGTTVGPFAHLRNRAHIGERCRIGNFVEVKGSTFGNGAKASHLSYVGDASVGARANIGAGTITCNYDGVKKHRTTIGEGAFIGSNSTLVAPLEVGAHAYTAAGSTVTEDVPEGALALGRARQVLKPGWASRRKEMSRT